jgi:predicted nucleic acid-binding Zn ribbon protein
VSDDRHCPACGAEREPGQLVCLHCGGRLSLTRPRPDRWRPTTILALIAVALAAGGIGFGVASALDDDDDASAKANADRRTATLQRQQAQERREQRAERRRAVQERARKQAQSGTWPEDLSAYTVVLVTAGDEASARQTADEASAGGVDAGVLRSDDYGLGQGFWIVYAGTYEDQQEAAAKADELGEQYPGAYSQLVNGSS